MAVKAKAQNLQRLPPQNVEAEKSLLGALLLDKEAIIRVAEFLRPVHFYNPAHADVFTAILDLFEKGIPVDLITLTDALKKRKKLKRVGGRSYLTGLVDAVPTSAHAENYGEIVRDTSVRRELISAASEIDRMGYDEDSLVDETLDKAEQALFSVSQQGVRERFAHVKDLLKEAYEKAEEIDRMKGKILGIPTGFRDLDNILGGLQKSDLILLASRPSVGKTAFALDIARSVAVKEKKKVAMFSLEMSEVQLMERILAMQAMASFWELRTGRLPDEVFERLADAMGELAEAELYIDDKPGQNIMEMRTKARRLHMEKGLDLIIVDYLQLIQGRSRENRVQEVSEISMFLKNLARELEVPVLAASQLSRAVEARTSRIPQLYDLRESGSLEQDADVVIFIHREDQYNPEAEKKGVADIIVAKHRNGPTGMVKLAFVKERASFCNLEKRRGEED